MESLRNCFRVDKSALGNRACIASRAVLETAFVSARHTTGIQGCLLLRNSHEILSAQVIAKSSEQIVITRIGIIARSSEGADRRRHREHRHRSVFLHSRCHRRSKSSLRARNVRSEHVHTRHRIPRCHGWHHRWHHPIHTSSALVRNRRRHWHLTTIVRTMYGTGSTSEWHEG